MTVHEIPQAPPAAPLDDGEVDLRHYVDVLIAWWKEILLIGVAFALFAGGIVLLRDQLGPAQYVAQADIVVARLVNEITMDDRFRTEADDMGVANAANSRRAALVELVRNGAIATVVAENLDPALFGEEMTPATLLGMIEAEMPLTADGRNSSDLIRIYAAADTPEKAAIIANAWAEQYVEQINTVYGSVPAEVYQSVQDEMQSSRSVYEAAQRDLEAFISSSQIDSLSQQITESVTLRDNYQLGHTEVISTVISQDRVTRLKLFTDLTSAQENARNQVLGQQASDLNRQLTERYQARAQARGYLANARNLLAQVQQGGDAAAVSNALALQLLKAQSLTLVDAETLPTNLYLNADVPTPEDADAQATDVEALISTLDDYITQLTGEIETISLGLLAGQDYMFLDRLTADNLAATATYTTSAGVTSTAVATDDLSVAINHSFQELFGLGDMAQLSLAARAGDDAVGQKTAELNLTIQDLRARLAAEQSKERLLTQQRNLAWSTYEALSNKAAELNLERSAVNSEVRMGALAVAPSTPVSGPNPLLVAVVAGFLGLLFGVFVAFLADFMGQVPFLSRIRSQPA